ncbi:MAG: ATP synthase F1 subunit gamma [Bacteroidales bacterium]|nr:ATP synthase F1 subunit gamma [Bacteroidales bacterium]
MARLKEIKSRLQSVQSTRKITSAMMMVSSAKQKRAERFIQHLRPYERTLQRILHPLLNGEDEEQLPSPFMEIRPVKRVALVAFSSNTGLAGRFNEAVAVKLREAIGDYQSLGKENIFLYPVGEKITKAVRKMKFKPREGYTIIADKPAYNDTRQLGKMLMEMFKAGEIDRVELIYHRFKSTRTQELIRERLLPISSTDLEQEASKGAHADVEYILEPDRNTLLEQLIPKIVKIRLFAAHVDSVTSEHAARMTAMQIATDNADDLVDELHLEYNKLRQQSITNELLDIMGGSFGR